MASTSGAAHLGESSMECDWLDVDQGRAGIEGIPGTGHGDDPPAESRMLGDVGKAPATDAHLGEAEGAGSWKANTGHTTERPAGSLAAS